MKNPSEHLSFQLESLEEFINIIYDAGLQEVSTPKPGNVGPSQIIDGVSYQDYCHILQLLKKFNSKYFDKKNIRSPDFSIGNFIFQSVHTMVSNPPYKNLLLGHILLYSPLIFAFDLLFRNDIPKKVNWNKFWNTVEHVIATTTPQDGIWLSKAIQISNAGGIKTPGNKPLVSKYDFTKSSIETIIIEDQKTMKDLFQESADFDMISAQYCTNYEFCRNFYLQSVFPIQNPLNSQEKDVKNLFLQILATVPDSLIFRKNGTICARDIQNRAKAIIKAGGITTQAGLLKIKELNQKMLESKGKLNPGTTADLTACVLIIEQLFNR
ncbi:triphosphoribosyl-dephospho-CoA synthase [Candidatus Lokiarchaeum ossiferum]|uniref:triphosphoribosyl-dephospho-CoA synthase n=1 Tax=Candidatus Lokiarchaeum ossiferum TaxID=2951803 RepID=UPI00352C4CCD